MRKLVGADDAVPVRRAAVSIIGSRRSSIFEGNNSLEEANRGGRLEFQL